MRCENIVIEELVMRLPGVRQDEAAGLAEEILRKVQQKLRSSGRLGRCDFAQLKVRVPGNVKRAQLVESIANQLAEALR